MYDDKFLRDIMKDIEECFLIDGKGFIILDGYEYIRDITTLYAKQHNLLESTLLLLENNNVEEAVVLARSLLNNYFLIGYLLNDHEDRRRLKTFHNQPLISRKFQLKNMKEFISNNTSGILSQEQKAEKLKKIKQELFDCNELFKKNGIDKNAKPLSIINLAKNCDERGFGLYTSFYSDASKYEHSDITCLDLYKKKFSDDFSNNQVFTLNMSSTDEVLKEKILRMVEMIYCDTFSKIMNNISEKEKHLLVNFDQTKIIEVSRKITNKFLNEIK
ncbi:DUF5677 domain-containing protein [Clostridium perfringens]|uniref:DUF5677 domain-containing protein n=1 Tax=Clostridium perfringens TaxID=1502 RepID=UPI00103FA3F4|nr:DUF5677 domain-containing protein [Clostridium perfringens]TBX12784.1 hypothetical protein BFS03_05960 [Clostridium perfringens]